MYQYILVIHILAACIWTGGHLFLSIGLLPGSLAQRNINPIVEFESAYEKVGLPALAIQILSGLWLAWQITPDFSVWFAYDNPVSRLIIFKISLLTVTALLALDARLRIIPKLSMHNLTSLAWHIVAVTLISILFVIVGVSFRFGGL